MQRFLIVPLVLALCAGAALAADKTDWAAFKPGDAVELDSACTGNFRRVSIDSIGADPYSPSARKYTIRRQDGSHWSFSAPGIVAPCMRPLSAAAAAPVVASGPPQPLQGLYLQMQPTGTAYAYIHYYFWKDGRYCEGLPVGGVDREPADFDTLARQQTCGHYRVAGQRMSLQSQSDAQPHEVSLRNVRNHQDGFEMNGYATAPVLSYSNDQRLDGTYSASVIGGQSTTQVYVFHRDGSYTFKSTPVTSRDGPARASSGTYRLIGNTLQLSGGPGPERVTVYPFPNGGIMIAGNVFSR